MRQRGQESAAALAAQEEENPHNGMDTGVGKHLLDGGFIEFCQRSRSNPSNHAHLHEDAVRFR